MPFWMRQIVGATLLHRSNGAQKLRRIDLGNRAAPDGWENIRFEPAQYSRQPRLPAGSPQSGPPSAVGGPAYRVSGLTAGPCFTLFATRRNSLDRLWPGRPRPPIPADHSLVRNHIGTIIAPGAGHELD